MEGPLLTKSDHNVDDDTIHGDSYSTDEHIVDVTIHGDSSSDDEHIVDVRTNGDSSSNDDHIVDVTTYSLSSSADEQTSGVQRIVVPTWILVEFFVALVQIVAAIVVLKLTKDEPYPQKIFVILIIGYTCGCIATLLFLGWLFWRRIVISEIGIVEDSEVLYDLKRMLDFFFVGWVALLLRDLVSYASSLDFTKQYFWLCMAFLAISCILHVRPNFNCALLCFFIPMTVSLIKLLDFVDEIDENLIRISTAILVCIVILNCISAASNYYC